MQIQFEKTTDSLRDITASLSLTTLTKHSKQLTMCAEQSPLQLLDFRPEGIDEKVAEVKKMVDFEGNEPAVAVIVWGFGGIGKSTLASSVIQQLNWSSTDFKFCKVTIDEKTPDKKSHIIKLQKDIIRDFGGLKLDLRDVDEGRKELQKIMEIRSCFLFIDNLVDQDYLKQLLPEHFKQSQEMTGSMQKMKEPKLRILITSRENNLRHLLGIKECKEYHVCALSDEAAKIVLRKTILRESAHESELHYTFDELGLMNAVAEACGGVPLLLSTFGNVLKVERNPRTYKEALEALRKGDFDSFGEEERLTEKLMFVCHKIRDQEAKEAFFDICAYFQGWNWDIVGNIVDSTILEHLHKRMLVNRSDSDRVIVHDIIRLMGIKIGKEKRISNCGEFKNSLQDELKLKDVKGVSLLDDTYLIPIESEHLNSMQHSLRVLCLGDWVVLNSPCDGAFENLRYLSVGDVTAFPFSNASKLKKLRVLHNRSNPGIDLPKLPPTLKAIYQYVPYPDCDELATLPFQNLKSLEAFHVETQKPVKLSQGFYLPASLKNLNISGCSQLPQRFDHLTKVEWLSLNKCGLESLPEGFGRLTKLKYLRIEQCPNLTHFSEGFGSLCSLTHLSLEGCTRLETLPADFGNLTALQYLWMGGCKNLRILPEDFGGLSSLGYVDTSGCTELQQLPESFSKLSIQTLTLESCNSLTALPSSFVQLRMLEKLTIGNCIRLATLPRDFGQLSKLQHMIVKKCPILKELPDGFQKLPALRQLTLTKCRNLVNLLAGFGELKCLEELVLNGLLLSTLPQGFGNLKSLKKLQIMNCLKLETLPDGFENLVSLRNVFLNLCPMMDGAAMDRIAKLQNCNSVDIECSAKLVERWKETQNKEAYPMAVTGFEDKEEEWQSTARAALSGVKSNDGHQLIFDVDSTVAVIQLPLELELRHQNHFNKICQKAMERSRAASSGQPQIIICLPNVELGGQRPSEEEEEESIRKALEWLPQGACPLPATDIRRRFLFEYLFFSSYSKSGKLACFMADVRVQNNGPVVLVGCETTGEENNFEKLLQNPQKSENLEEENETPNKLQECIKILCNTEQEEEEDTAETLQVQSPHPPKGSVFTMFVQALKEKDVHHFIDCNMKKVNVDQLEGKSVNIIMCSLNTLEFIILQQLHKDLQGFNFEGVWIPLSNNENYGFGTYRRACGCMPWLTLPDPKVIQGIKESNAHFIFLDKEGKIISKDALSLAMSWGIKAYPFTQTKSNEIISKLPDKSSLEFLLEDIDILDYEGDKVDKGLINRKLTFLYAEHPSEHFKLKSKLDQILRVHKEFKVLYIGHFSSIEQKDIEVYKRVYEESTKRMHWLKLSFWDMVKFWYRCKYLSDNVGRKQNLSLILPSLVKQLYLEERWLVFLDGDGIVTRSGIEVADIICKSNDENGDDMDIVIQEEIIKSLESGKCNRIVRTYFSDEITNHPQHPHHPLSLTEYKKYVSCDVCYSILKVSLDCQRIYSCKDCGWDLCKDCWEAFAIKQAQCMLEL